MEHPLQPVQWIGDAAGGHLRLLDQTLLPGTRQYLQCKNVQSVWDAIKRLSVRGAPAIGIAAAYGCVVGSQRGDASASLIKAADHLATSRPTAVNLFWALDRMKKIQPRTPDALLAEAKRIHDEDRAMCRRIGEHGLKVFRRTAGSRAWRRGGKKTLRVLTHCNAGALATGGIGTATAPMYLAKERGLPIRVIADETRPLLQGARLTAYELQMAGIDVTLQCDNMAAAAMKRGMIDLVIVGADRIAANGDAANKIGTYGLAVLAAHHGIPFFVAAPSTTFDLKLPDGSAIPIEERDGNEIIRGFGNATAPAGVKTFNPAFDVTPHELITGLITERGVIQPVDAKHVRLTLGASI